MILEDLFRDKAASRVSGAKGRIFPARVIPRHPKKEGYVRIFVVLMLHNKSRTERQSMKLKTRCSQLRTFTRTSNSGLGCQREPTKAGLHEIRR